MSTMFNFNQKKKAEHNQMDELEVGELEAWMTILQESSLVKLYNNNRTFVSSL